MRYLSTRGEAERLDFAQCLLAGLARDGGLYLPETWPSLDEATMAGFAGKPFHAVATHLIGLFAGQSIPPAVLAAASEAAYAQFGHPAVTPLVQIGPNDFVLELFHGPTLAFKDVAMQVLARLMDFALEQRGSRATIIGATSGDTGGAAIEAFRTSRRADLFMLFPDGRVSDVQRRMMTVPREKHVHAIAVPGTFDDCQALVKAAFNHHAFRDEMALSGVNSINWARITAQITYYFVAAMALGAPRRHVAFFVPTGNFGDIFAGHVARRLGLPIASLVIATNSNDILARTLETGQYRIGEVAATTSPSMDIQLSSNFERLLFEAADGDGARIRRLMAQLSQSGGFELDAEMLARIRKEFQAYRAGEDEIAEAIRQVHAQSGYLLDPHSATGYVAAQKAKLDPAIPRVLLATAAPAKFPETMRMITGLDAPLPARLAGLMSSEERIARIGNDIGSLETFIRAHRRGGSPPQA